MNGDQPNSTDQAAAPQKSAVIDKIKGANSILVAISADPSIDQLASAVGLTLILEKIKKNVTAVFSGKVPSALEFLKPTEHFQKNTDSLRDFIIAIDKSKADKLRYKVEDNIVKIFITPYKTSISEKDLQYSAGDFNIDVIVALGVQHQQDIDTAISAHGRIFHDAAVVSINNVPGGDFGVSHWEDATASSLSELIAQFAGELGPTMLDADISTALLTGIVAETGRFSNEKTHPSTMTISSTLLQAGADQQLVNQQLSAIMGTEVKLEAGSEIRPTMSAEELAAQQSHVEEELVIGDDGQIQVGGHVDEGQDDKTDTESASAPESVTAPGDEQSAESTEAPQTDADPHTDTQEELMGELKIDTAKNDEPASNSDDEKADDEPEPDLVVPAPDVPAQPEASASPSSAGADTAEAAHKAISEALKTATVEAEHITSTSHEYEALPSEPAPPAPEAAQPPVPVMQPPVLPNIPPAPSVVPPIGSEPAPLASSPADQPFTMPMPPPSSLAQAPPVVLPPTAPAPGAVPSPPPLPPPLPPAQ